MTRVGPSPHTRFVPDLQYYSLGPRGVVEPRIDIHHTPTSSTAQVPLHPGRTPEKAEAGFRYLQRLRPEDLEAITIDVVDAQHAEAETEAKLDSTASVWARLGQDVAMWGGGLVSLLAFAGGASSAAGLFAVISAFGLVKKSGHVDADKLFLQGSWSWNRKMLSWDPVRRFFANLDEFALLPFSTRKMLCERKNDLAKHEENKETAKTRTRQFAEELLQRIPSSRGAPNESFDSAAVRAALKKVRVDTSLDLPKEEVVLALNRVADALKFDGMTHAVLPVPVLDGRDDGIWPVLCSAGDLKSALTQFAKTHHHRTHEDGGTGPATFAAALPHFLNMLMTSLSETRSVTGAWVIVPESTEKKKELHAYPLHQLDADQVAWLAEQIDTGRYRLPIVLYPTRPLSDDAFAGQAGLGRRGG